MVSLLTLFWTVDCRERALLKLKLWSIVILLRERGDFEEYEEIDFGVLVFLSLNN